MNFKLIILMVEDARTRDVVDAAKKAGATVLNQTRGEGVTPHPTVLGLSLDSLVDVVLLLAAEAIGVTHQIKVLSEARRKGRDPD